MQQVADLRQAHRRRIDMHRPEKVLTLVIKGICRRLCEGDKGEAAVLYAAAFESKGEHPMARIAALYCLPHSEARALLVAQRKFAEKHMEDLARQLPVWPWVESVKGLGALGLAQIIGEVGDLSRFANPAKLWKMLGLAVLDGRAQRCVRGVGALEQKYNPRRRSVSWVVADSLLRQKNPYRDLYLARKAHEEEQHPELTKMHRHLRAKRYAEKRMIRDLWVAWRATSHAS